MSDGVGLPGAGAALVRASPATGLESEVRSETLPQGAPGPVTQQEAGLLGLGVAPLMAGGLAGSW